MSDLDRTIPTPSGKEPASATLGEALQRFSLDVTSEQERQLHQYCQLLWNANEHINLTRHTTFDKFVGRDVVDSHWLARLVTDARDVLDVGTGGGVPGIPLAILRPDLEISLCESIRKKAQAVDRIVQHLGLAVPVHHARAEDLLEDFRYDVLTTRAIGSMQKILTWLRPHWPSVGSLFLLKGPRWVEERKEAREKGLLNGLELRRLATYHTPFVSEAVVLRVRTMQTSRDGC